MNNMKIIAALVIGFYVIFFVCIIIRLIFQWSQESRPRGEGTTEGIGFVKKESAAIRNG